MIGGLALAAALALSSSDDAPDRFMCEEAEKLTNIIVSA